MTNYDNNNNDIKEAMGTGKVGSFVHRRRKAGKGTQVGDGRSRRGVRKRGTRSAPD